MKQIAVAAIVLAVVLIAGCTDDMSADQIAARMEAQQESIKDFSATMVMTSSFSGETETTRPDMKFHRKLQQLQHHPFLLQSIQ